MSWIESLKGPWNVYIIAYYADHWYEEDLCYQGGHEHKIEKD